MEPVARGDGGAHHQIRGPTARLDAALGRAGAQQDRHPAGERDVSSSDAARCRRVLRTARSQNGRIPESLDTRPARHIFRCTGGDAGCCGIAPAANG